MNDDSHAAPSQERVSGLAAFEDSELLRRYAETRAEDAFAELVRRRIGLVYSVALRQTRGDRHRAEDVTQAVFSDLARKAETLAQRPVLAGWLYRSAQFAAAGTIRAEQRRQSREQEAHTMEKILAPDAPEPDWTNVRPVLDQALSEIEERDRDAIVLRFFDGRPFADIGARLRLTENAARMRVERALDKLNAALARRGITSTTTALGLALGHQVGAAMPAGLAASVTGAALAGSATAGAGGWLTSIFLMNKLQLGIAGAVTLAGAAGYVTQAQTQASLRQEVAALQSSQHAVASLRAENQRLSAFASEVETLRHDDREFAQLGQRIAAVQTANQEADRRIRATRLSEQRASQDVQAEIDRLNREGNKLVDEYKKLAERSKDSALSAEDRSAAEAAAKIKMEEIRAKQREVQAFKAAAGVSDDAKYQSRPVDPNAPRVGGTITAAPPAGVSTQGGFTFRPAEGGGSVQLQLLSAYERLSGTRIIRDPSLAGAAEPLNLILPTALSREEALQIFKTALREQMNITLETAADGTVTARRTPPR